MGFLSIVTAPDTVSEFVEHRLPVQNIGSLNPNRVKPITYQIDTCHHLALHLALIE